LREIAVKPIWLLLAGLLAVSIGAPAQAQLRLGGGIDYFTWQEDTSPYPVKENGPLLVLHLGYLQRKDRGVLFGYAGKFYYGDVDYEGSTLADPPVPLAGTTRYTGMMHEVQLRYRLPPKRGYWLDFMGAAGIDFWRRELSSVQREDWRVGFLRLGAEMDTPNDQGFILGAGVKYPFYTWEDPHFPAIGLNPDTKLEPGKDWSVYGQVGYRFRRSWQLVAYVDSFRFRESSSVSLVSSNPTLPSGPYFQPQSTLYTWGVKLEYLFR
jgi:hypothetical protein